MKQKTILILCYSLLFLMFCSHNVYGQTGKDAVLKIRKTNDFFLDGNGTAKNWSKTHWVDISVVPSSKNKSQELATKVKVLYSDTGMYFLFKCEDQILRATLKSNFANLWTEDVVEVFLWPNEDNPTIFEYELSPLNYELILRVTHDDRGRSLWRPFSYDNDRRTRHMTFIEGGKKESGALITGWTAEFFLPYKLLHPSGNIPPQPGTQWRANFYRIDYDIGQVLLAWQPVSQGFHEYSKFGTIIFE